MIIRLDILVGYTCDAKGVYDRSRPHVWRSIYAEVSTYTINTLLFIFPKM